MVLRTVRAQRGFILIIILGLLGVLAFLALTLMQGAKTARELSLHQVHRSKARLAARSGLDKAVTALMGYAWRNIPISEQSFQRRLESSGDDRNRNGLEDDDEDLAADGFLAFADLEEDLTPALALAEDPADPAPRSLIMTVNGRPSGVSWIDKAVSPGVLAKIGLGGGVGLDLNGGIESGTGVMGAKYQTEFGLAYSASDLAHPFNVRTRILFNAWGNYYKYRAMIRPDKTYLDTLPMDDPANMTVNDAGTPISSRYSNPFGRFDRFDASRDVNMATTELPLGDRLISARPVGGYTSLKVPLEILGQYIDQWQDRAGAVRPAWRYADGSTIGEVPVALLREMELEFARLAQLHPARRDEVLVIPGQDFPAPDPYDVADSPHHFSSFETPEGRSYLNMRFYTVKAAGIDVHVAPLSVLVAACHGVRDVTYAEYWPGSTDVAEDFLRQKKLVAPKENSHFISAVKPVAGDPLFSMTDSIRLAGSLISKRSLKAFASLKEVGDEIRGWSDSYDGRGLVFDARTRSTSFFQEYIDLFTGHARAHVLAYLLNPHVNSNHLVWDEAQVPSWNQRILSLGDRGPLYGYRDFSFKNIFDRFMPHKSGGTLSIGEGQRKVRVLGFSLSGSGAVLARSRIETSVEFMSRQDIHVQRDLERAATVPGTTTSTLADRWVTYPELANVSAADWDGQLALRPQIQECPFGDEPRLRVTLNGYDGDATVTTPNDKYWPIGPRTLAGPDEHPARGKLTNSLRPPPGVANRSLVCTQYSQIGEASDLLPGGGIRVSPYNNTLSFGSDVSAGNYTNRREALLVLCNTNVDDSEHGPSPDLHLQGREKILPSFHEGAISFYFKPRFSCTKDGNLSKGNQTICTIPFVIHDPEVIARCEAIGLDPAMGAVMSYYTALMRLCWGPCESKGSGRFDDKPLTWPWVMPYSHAAFPGQASCEPHLFSTMRGVVDTGGAAGYVMMPNMPDGLGGLFNTTAGWVPMGDGRPWHWSAPNPYADERLQLEFIISKFADVPYNTGVEDATVENLNETFHDPWDALDMVSKTAETDAYVSPQPLHLFDTSSLLIMGHHTVRKTFILCHPYKTDPGPSFGCGPRDSGGNHQPLLAPGRWNHLLVVWKDLYDLLNNGGAHRGGCLATYINGTFNRTSPLGFSMGGLFVEQDLSELYPTDNALGPWSPWQPSDEHDPYQDIFFGRFSRIPRYFPLYQEARYDGDFYKHKYYTFPQMTAITSENPLDYFHPIPGMHAFQQDGSFLHAYDYSRFSRGHYSCRNEDLFLKFPSRFFFGFVPFTQREYADPATLAERPYAATSMSWGSFMDIQIFSRASSLIINTDGEFVANLPNWENFSPYLNVSGPVFLYPLNVKSQHDLGRGLRLAEVSWNAHLPEFHQFWDDQSSTVAGLDPIDAQDLRCSIEVNGSVRETLKANQLPSTPGLRSQWQAQAPEVVDAATDLRLELAFRGPKVTMSTPIIESFELALLYDEPRYHDYIME